MNKNVLVGKSRLSHRLYSDLLNCILSGDYPTNSRLPAASRRKHEAFAFKEHERVVRAIIDGDAEEARRSMRHHLEQSLKRLFGG